MHLLYNEFVELKRGGSILLKGRAVASLYEKVFSEKLDLNCGRCITQGFNKLDNFFMEQNKTCKYRFSKEFANKTFTLNVNGTMVRVNSENISDNLAELILANPRIKAGVIEVNPNYDGIDKKKVTGAESVTSSTLIEVLDGLNTLEESANVKELPSQELQELTVSPKKRGRPSKKQLVE